MGRTRERKKKRRRNPAAGTVNTPPPPKPNIEMMGAGLALAGIGLFMAGLLGAKIPPEKPKETGKLRLIKGGKL